MSIKKKMRKFISAALSYAILSTLSVSYTCGVSAVQESGSTPVNDPSVVAHCIYSGPDLSQTSGNFLSFMIDFKADSMAPATYWQLCQAKLDNTELKQKYPTISDAVFYGGFQLSPNKINTLFSFWDVLIGNDESNVVTTPTRVYPEGAEHTFGGEGNGHNWRISALTL